MDQPFIPSLKQVAEAAEKLPIPDLWPEDSYLIPIPNTHSKQDLKIHKLAFRNLENQVCYHWVYDGKVTVETTTP
ncbi:MAG: hypothetical protein F7B06_11475 [Opitutae bacterium]|nr:hypothetical protein [Opitutae bacterium]